MTTLFLIATPIGNLEDITLRALRLLAEVSLVAAEDTRTTRKLFARHGIRQRLMSYNEHNMKSRTPQLLASLADGDIAFVSEAGTPGVSDPGYELTRAALDSGFEVVAIPGPSAVITALTASGLPMREFIFLGFVPRRQGERRRFFESSRHETRTLVAFESPHRLRRTLSDMLTVLGDRRVAVCRELTKVFEEIFRSCISEALQHFAEPRGEFTLVIEGSSEAPALASEESVRKSLLRLRATAVRGREAVRQVTEETGLPHREVYRLWVQINAPTNPAARRTGRPPSSG
jgi:16S rRNA (cytidine1402-2'-O)-methyltransferase